MTRPVPTYANARTPTPCDAYDLLVVDADTGERLNGVTEINTAEGWLIRHVLADDGVPIFDPEINAVKTELVKGHFRMQWKT